MLKITKEGDMGYNIARFISRYGRTRFTQKWITEYLSRIFYRQDSSPCISVYGPLLSARWGDHSFNMALTGGLGFSLEKILRRKRRKDFVFLDIGANMGIFSLLAARNKQCARVICIEPNPNVYESLIRNIEINKISASSCNFAIGEQNGILELYLKEGKSGRGNFRGAGGQKVEVEVRNGSFFDEITPLVEDMDIVVKIDVEGHEAVVLQELLASSIETHIKEIFVEITPAWVGEEGLKRIQGMMVARGFQEQSRHGKVEVQYDGYYIR